MYLRYFLQRENYDRTILDITRSVKIRIAKEHDVREEAGRYDKLETL